MTGTPHDALFKATFSQVVYAAEELRYVLPPELVAVIDFSTMQVEPGSFVDEALRARYTDLLYSLAIAGQDARIYVLFEHQSSGERWMALHERAASACVRLVLSALQQARTGTEVRKLMFGWVDLIQALLREPNGHSALGLIVRYLLEVRGAGELGVIDTTLREITADNGEVMQTIAQMLESRGMERGLQQGRQEVVLRLLRRRFGELPAAVTQRVTAAGTDELDLWADRLLFAGDLDEVFAAP
ncbi:MAG TPA: Rpn family recombination-promoting nuclease/putative transposase [Nannocystis sp.]